jgi:hypothetical protein
VTPGYKVPLDYFVDPPPAPPRNRVIREGSVGAGTGMLSWWGRLQRRMWPRKKAGRLSTPDDDDGKLSEVS